MSQQQRLVLDSNLLVSAIFFRSSTPARALDKAQQQAIMLASEAPLAELFALLYRPKFKNTGSIEIRKALLLEYQQRCEIISVHTTLHACRHPKDDKFLELALDGRADLILSGDNDLLTLHPFRGITILSPAQYLELVG